MARIRSIWPDICTSETMAALSAHLERTFARLWTHCDDEGRCKDNPLLIKAAIYPLHTDVTADTLDADLDELAAAGLLRRYTVDGQAVLEVRSWHEFQRPNRPSQSKLPAPPEPTLNAATHTKPDQPEPTTASALSEHSVSTHEQRTAGEGEGGEKERERENTRAAPEPQTLAVVPTTTSPPPAARRANTDDDFDRFWTRYPRKVAKPQARKAWAKATKRATPDQIIAGVDAHLDPWATFEAEYIPHASTWLNGDRWADDPPPPRGSPAAPRASAAMATIEASLARMTGTA